MTLCEYLQGMREVMPPWLGEFKIGDTFPRQQFFASRVVYYPGSATDGHPVKLFGSTHCAHCFVYADYGVSEDTLTRELEDPNHGFLGYHSLARLELRESDLVPGGWAPHAHPGDLARDRFATVRPFGFLEVLERDPRYDDTHGARRLAVLFLGADGIAAYDALFGQPLSVAPPFAIIVQDHGFGGNYDRFGRNGLLERIARRPEDVPRWLLVAENTDPWEGFVRVPDVDGDRGGVHGMLRCLYERCDN